MNSMAGIQVLHVPYRGSAPAVTDVATGAVTMSFSSLAAALPLISAGNLRAVAVTSRERMPQLPDVAPLSEGAPGLAGYELLNWFAMFGTAGTPPEIVERLNGIVNTALKDPAIADKLLPQGIVPKPMKGFRTHEIRKDRRAGQYQIEQLIPFRCIINQRQKMLRREDTMNVKPNTQDAKPVDDKRSHHVRPQDLPWEKMRFPGCQTKTLLFDPKSGLATVLIKMEPGAALPDHEHVLIEQTYVLEGSLVDKAGPDTGLEVGPGEFVWRPAGSRHEAWCPKGGTMIAMFQVPNKFFETDGKVTDAGGKDWQSAWGHVLSD
jgi:quercetin dioxygenase-like cupin family protein